MTIRRYGYRPDTRDRSKDTHARHLLGTPYGPTLPDSASLEGFAGEVVDQGQTSSCVGCALATAAFTEAGASGHPCAWPSEACGYTMARVEERGRLPATATHGADPLTDEGCMPGDALDAAEFWGLASAKAWPFDEKRINTEPDLAELESAQCFKLTGRYRIPVDDAALDLCAAALVAGHPVLRGGPADTAFENYDGTGLVTAADPDQFQGGHETCVIAYQRLATGGRKWKVKNSWSKSWGADGWFWADDEWLKDSQDLNVITGHAVKEPS